MRHHRSWLPVCLFIVGGHISMIFFLYVHAMMETTEYGHWEPALASILIELVFLLILLGGLRRAPGQDYADLFIPLGKGWSIVLLAPLIAYFLLSVFMMLRSFAELMRIAFIVNTPIWALLGLLILLLMFGAFMGGESIIRANVLLSFLFLPVLLFALCSCFKNTDFHYLFPIWNPSFDFVLDTDFYTALFAISPFLVIGMLPPLYAFTGRSVILALLPTWVLYLVCLYIPILVFGITAAKLLVFPFLSTMDSVNLLWLVFDRVTLFYAAAVMAFISSYGSFLLWSVGRIVNKRFPKCPEKAIVVAACLATDRKSVV